MNDADRIWNRAALDDGGESPAQGDIALSALLYAHGLVMNGGVLHAVELLNDDEFAGAQKGYAFFDLSVVSELLSRARNQDATDNEAELDAEYLKHIPDDSALTQRFDSHLASHPSDFAPSSS